MKMIGAFALGLMTAGCGTVVPNLSYTEEDKVYVRDVHLSIRCELAQAINEAYRQSEALALARQNGGNENVFGRFIQKNKSDFFKKWGVKYTLKLKVIEDSSLAPQFNVLSPVTPASMLNPGDVVFTLNKVAWTS